MEEDDKVVGFFKDILKSVYKYKNVVSVQDYENVILDYIFEATAKYYAVSKYFILRPTRKGEIVEARKMCIALIKEHLSFSDGQIGKYLGGRSRQYVNKELNSSPLSQDKLMTKDEVKFVEDFLILTKDVDIFKKSCNIEIKTKLDE